MSKPFGQGPRDDERLAAKVYSNLTGVDANFHETGPQAADFQLGSPESPIGFMEVTSVRHGEMKSLAAAITNHHASGLIVPNSKLEWNLILVADKNTSVKQVRKVIVPILITIEQRCPEGINLMPFSREFNWEGTDPIIYDLFDLGVGFLAANPSPTGATRVGFNRATRAAFDMDLPSALESTFDKNNLKKLALAGSGGAKIQFVWVDRHRAAGAEMAANWRKSEQEIHDLVRQPRLPDDVTEVWAALEVQPGEVWVWVSNGLVWSRHVWVGAA